MISCTSGVLRERVGSRKRINEKNERSIAKPFLSCQRTGQHQSEIDALVAHLYGLSREDFDHILGTFPLVFPDTDEGWAKRQALLDTFEAWQRA
jgi:hypothetical protein